MQPRRGAIWHEWDESHPPATMPISVYWFGSITSLV
jgi:hypothetical protein